jgi:cation diffusion facilitator family transporter
MEGDKSETHAHRQALSAPDATYRREVHRVLWITLVLNLLVAIAKLIVGIASNSLAVIGDAAHSAVDSANNVVGLIAVQIASKGADDDHPYGHSKIETLAAFVLAGLLWVTCFEIAIEAIRRLFQGHAEASSATPAAFAVIGTTLIVNIFVSRYEARKARELRSDFLLADAAHTRSDVLVTLTVLASLLLVRFGWERVDAVLSLLIAGLIGRIGFQVFQRTVPILVDASALEENTVRRVVEQVAGVENAHAIRTRRAGEVIFLDLHIVIDPEMGSEQAHDISERVEEKLTLAFGQTSSTVHVETSRHCGF